MRIIIFYKKGNHRAKPYFSFPKGIKNFIEKNQTPKWNFIKINTSHNIQ